MAHDLIYRKTCGSLEKAQKEGAVLLMLQKTSLRDFVPKPMRMEEGSLVLEMTLIPGTNASSEDMSGHTLARLGIALKELHDLRCYGAFGTLNERVEVPNPFFTFQDFLKAQIEKWGSWHKANSSTSQRSFVVRILLELERLEGYFRSIQPLLCHGDVDAKNLIVRQTNLVGLIDWEHAGAYCFAWELRKLPNILRYDWQWQSLLASYDDPIKTDRSDLLKAVYYLNTVDLLGHLRWCMRKGSRASEIETRKRMFAYLNSNKEE